MKGLLMKDELMKAFKPQKKIMALVTPTVEQMEIPDHDQHGKVIKLCPLCTAPEYEKVAFHTHLCLTVNNILHRLQALESPPDE